MIHGAMPVFLHVGCGMNRKPKTTRGFNTADWDEIRLDIDPAVAPDIVGTMTDMSGVAGESVDAIFSSHNIEHLYAHETPLALAEFRRVLKPAGFAVITCPDLQSVAAVVAQDKLNEPLYVAPAGPISAHDTMYGFGVAMARGNLFMAHRCGFTRRTLLEALQQAGFPTVAAMQRAARFDLWALASKTRRSNDDMHALVTAHFPVTPA
jgi:predicted SAM-dependent methyltransferase